jgi:preprotein translocase subunit SecB
VTKKTAKTRTAKSQLTPEKYIEFVAKVALEGIGLDSAAIKLDRDSLVGKDGSMPLSFDTSFSVVAHETDKFVILADSALTARRNEDGENKESFLNIKFTFSALFKLGIPCDSETAQHFANTEAKLIFWPYLRHFVADTMYRMAVNPAILPIATNLEAPTSAAK